MVETSYLRPGPIKVSSLSSQSFLSSLPYEILLICLSPITALDLANFCKYAETLCYDAETLSTGDEISPKSIDSHGLSYILMHERVLWERHVTPDPGPQIDELVTTAKQFHELHWTLHLDTLFIQLWQLAGEAEVEPVQACHETWIKYWDGLGPLEQKVLLDKNPDINIASSRDLADSSKSDLVPRALRELKDAATGGREDDARTFERAVEAHRRYDLPFSVKHYTEYCSGLLRKARNLVRINLPDAARRVLAVEAVQFCETYGHGIPTERSSGVSSTLLRFALYGLEVQFTFLKSRNPSVSKSLLGSTVYAFETYRLYRTGEKIRHACETLRVMADSVEDQELCKGMCASH